MLLSRRKHDLCPAPWTRCTDARLDFSEEVQSLEALKNMSVRALDTDFGSSLSPWRLPRVAAWTVPHLRVVLEVLSRCHHQYQGTTL